MLKLLMLVILTTNVFYSSSSFRTNKMIDTYIMIFLIQNLNAWFLISINNSNWNSSKIEFGNRIIVWVASKFGLCLPDLTLLLFPSGHTWNSRYIRPLRKYWKTLNDAIWTLVKKWRYLCSNMYNVKFKQRSRCSLQHIHSNNGTSL